MPKEIRDHAKEKLELIKENRPGFCAGYDYVSLLKGQKDFSVYYRTLIWDHLPGSMIYQEAGGYALGLDAQPYIPKNEGTGLMCAANEEMWHKIKNSLFSYLKSLSYVTRCSCCSCGNRHRLFIDLSRPLA